MCECVKYIDINIYKYRRFVDPVVGEKAAARKWALIWMRTKIGELQDKTRHLSMQCANQSSNCSSKSVIKFESDLKDVERLVKLFFRNEFSVAQAAAEKDAATSLYHAMGLAYIKFLYALFTVEKVAIDNRTFRRNW